MYSYAYHVLKDEFLSNDWTLIEYKNLIENPSFDTIQNVFDDLGLTYTNNSMDDDIPKSNDKRSRRKRHTSQHKYNVDEFNLDEFDAWDAPPPPPEGPRVKFIPYDDPPVPLSPIRPRYPEIAQEAGIEGTVIVQVFVDEKGRVKETVILKGIPNTGLDEAASEAIRTVRFRPAKQRERAVGVWISIPVNFRLKS